jgi:hypothetical protein
MSSAAYPVRRSHWVLFAAVTLLVAGGVNAVRAPNLFADAGWVSDVSDGIAGVYWMPFAPIAGLAVVIIDILIVYGLLTTWSADEL